MTPASKLATFFSILALLTGIGFAFAAYRTGAGGFGFVAAIAFICAIGAAIAAVEAISPGDKK